MNTKTDTTTPRPWRVNPECPTEITILRGDSSNYLVAKTEESHASIDAKANAALIVRAVNEYNVLNEIVEEAEQERSSRAGTICALPEKLCSSLTYLSNLRGKGKENVSWKPRCSN